MTNISLRASWPLLLLFVAIVMGVGFIVGLIASPGQEWVGQIVLPSFVVPEPLSSLIWLLLCVAFAVAGWRLWQIDSSSVETRLWLAILILSWWYAPLFFVARAPLAALVVIALLTLLVAVFIWRAYAVDRLSALLFVPCFFWLVYATVITALIIQLNPDLALKLSGRV